MRHIYSLIFCALLVCGIAYADEIDDIVPCVIQVESSGNPNAVSKDGCIGLMQISPIVLREWNQDFADFCLTSYENGFMKYGVFRKKDMYNPEYNKVVGTWYLNRLKDHYLKENYTIERMLAAYNGGITRLRRVNYDISKMPRETRNYVKKVMTLYNKL